LSGIDIAFAAKRLQGAGDLQAQQARIGQFRTFDVDVRIVDTSAMCRNNILEASVCYDNVPLKIDAEHLEYSVAPVAGCQSIN
jgi:hypothetical protein